MRDKFVLNETKENASYKISTTLWTFNSNPAFLSIFQANFVKINSSITVPISRCTQISRRHVHYSEMQSQRREQFFLHILKIMEHFLGLTWFTTNEHLHLSELMDPVYKRKNYMNKVTSSLEKHGFSVLPMYPTYRFLFGPNWSRSPRDNID